MMYALIHRLFFCRRAAAAAEMALVTPLLIILMFGSFELGNYFLSEHVVAKAVRDGARYAARQPLPKFTCSTNKIEDDVKQKTRNVTRTGQVADGGDPRLRGWVDDATKLTVELSCFDNSADTYLGIYKGKDVPKVKVSATVPYHSLFNNLGFTSSTLNLVSESEATVQGL